MEITEEKYIAAKVIVNEYPNAKKIVDTYETKNKVSMIQKILDEKFAKNNYLNPYKDGEIMPCCGERYIFSYDRMKYLPRNKNLEYRKENAEGDVHYDKDSKQPSFVEYNNAREAIRQAKLKGLNHVHWKVSSAVSEQLRKDGYTHYNNGNFDMISWGKVSFWDLFK